MRFQLLFYVLSLFIINRTLNAQTLKITYRLGHSCSFGQDENGDPMRGACTVDQEFIYRFKGKAVHLLLGNSILKEYSQNMKMVNLQWYLIRLRNAY